MSIVSGLAHHWLPTTCVPCHYLISALSARKGVPLICQLTPHVTLTLLHLMTYSVSSIKGLREDTVCVAVLHRYPSTEDIHL
ncbi:hypothetical protein E2C01_000526 [Portunus trituberculatus]|uniref:Uncharacterized protein n=1 Tax=Portunus trituberculatus TaxID=210409 RepID=A0A5B7CEX2_PORTR|nr:hypothetical protein [Portunus trituberculatus]